MKIVDFWSISTRKPFRHKPKDNNGTRVQNDRLYAAISERQYHSPVLILCSDIHDSQPNKTYIINHVFGLKVHVCKDRQRPCHYQR